MPVPCRRRQAYDVPSTVSRGVILAPISPFVSSSHRSFPSSHPPVPFSVSILPFPPARSRERRSFLLVSVCMRASGEPLSKSYATRRQSSVDYFSKSSGSRIFKWRLNETGSSLVLLPDSLRSCERLFASAKLDPGDVRTLRSPGSFSVCSSLSLFSFAHRSSV